MKFSIIIPTVNRSASLKATLESIARQCGLDEGEVIVIDNGSTDNTKIVCDHFEELIPHFRYHYDAVPGLLTGRHKGAELAKGEILSFLDDDVELSPGWLEGVNAAFRHKDVHFATGPCLPKYEIYPPEWLNYFWTDSGYGGKHCGWLSLLDFGNKEMYVDPGCVWGLNFSLRKDTFLELGGFHPDCIPSNLQQFQGDGETGLTVKAMEKNYKAWYSPRMMLYHLVSADRVTIKYFEKRAYYQGVCDSFSDIRKQIYGNNQIISDQPVNNGSRTILPQIKRYIKQTFLKPVALPREVEDIRINIDKKYKEGYSFHQEAFNSSSLVRDWVLKANYLDYKLPGYDRKN